MESNKWQFEGRTSRARTSTHRSSRGSARNEYCYRACRLRSHMSGGTKIPRIFHDDARTVLACSHLVDLKPRRRSIVFDGYTFFFSFFAGGFAGSGGHRCIEATKRQPTKREACIGCDVSANTPSPRPARLHDLYDPPTTWTDPSQTSIALAANRLLPTMRTTMLWSIAVPTRFTIWIPVHIPADPRAPT